MKTLRHIVRSDTMLHLVTALVILLSVTALDAAAAEQKPAAGGGGEDMGAIGQKLANPLGDLWSLTFNWQALQFFDGDVNTGDPELGSTLIFQPVAPIPLYGEGDSEWRMITRPIIPIVFSTPIPTGFNEFDKKSGLGDIQLPLLLSFPPSVVGKKLIFGAGPIFEFPTATNDDLGADQWSMGPAVVLGYKAKDWTAVLFPNYFWKIGSAGQGDKPDTSKGTLLYSFVYKLDKGWQIGTNPTISYNDRATSGNKWNVPVGPFIGKTFKMGNTPVNIKLAAEYSVVSQDDFGQRFGLRLQITPVVKGLVKNPIFGK